LESQRESLMLTGCQPGGSERRVMCRSLSLWEVLRDGDALPCGDRYGAGIGAAQFKGRRKPENEVTLIAREAIEAAGFPPTATTRRLL